MTKSVREIVNNRSMASETKLGELEAKMKALNLTMGKSEEAILANNKEGLSSHIGSLAKKVEDMKMLRRHRNS